ncbi:uncharacterized protein PADG_08445 [Paracoccidioides brasiliensis Pb18]|uniref:Uncharacterized protein n=1 Tax=Paracoccidioides brasiliensis (strain Pb18) TaxID=502780 RepID=C1GMF9_PARBD|nr:uncharacterized protein PADG_08445 [Paracoccidioides brasiliensis Pb18]EEH43625.2 hypothetical protein PADG_08445 [Paracoccidioides brasiliensis Pb18]
MSTLRHASNRAGLQVLWVHHGLVYRHPLNLTSAPLQILGAIPTPTTGRGLQRTYVLEAHKPSYTMPLNLGTQSDPDSRYAINTDRHEYSQSGSDNAVASQQAAWDLNNRTPEKVREASLAEAMHDGHSKMGPLEVSPANRDVSQYTNEAGRGEFVEKGPSRRVSPLKGIKVNFSGVIINEKGEPLLK